MGRVKNRSGKPLYCARKGGMRCPACCPTHAACRQCGRPVESVDHAMECNACRLNRRGETR